MYRSIVLAIAACCWMWTLACRPAFGTTSDFCDEAFKRIVVREHDSIGLVNPRNVQLLGDGRLLVSEFDTGRLFVGRLKDDTVVIESIIEAPVSIIDSVVSDMQRSSSVATESQLLSIDEALLQHFPGVTTEGISPMFLPRFHDCAVRGGDTLDVTTYVMVPGLGKASQRRIWIVATAVVQLSLATNSLTSVSALISSGENYPQSVSIITTRDGWWVICSNFSEDVVGATPLAKPYFSRHLFDGMMTTHFVNQPPFINGYSGAFNVPSKIGAGSFVWTDSRLAMLFVSDINTGVTDSISMQGYAVDSLHGALDSLRVGSPILVDSTRLLVLVSGVSTKLNVRTARWIGIDLQRRNKPIVTGRCYTDPLDAFDRFFVESTTSEINLSALRRDENGDWYIRQKPVRW